MASETMDQELTFSCPSEAGAYFMTRRDPNREQTASEFGECSICFDDHSGKLACEHFLCSHCILYYAWQQLDRGQRKFCCQVCKAELSLDLAIQLGAPDKVEVLWLEKFLERNLKEDLEYKPKDASKKMNLLLRTATIHEISDETGAKVKVPELRVCPSCYTLIMHTEGCYQVTCVGCMKTFCFICLERVTVDSSCGTTVAKFNCQAAEYQIIKEPVLL